MQKCRLIEDYEPNWFYWVYADANRVGMLWFKPYDNAFHIHLLVVFPEYQKRQFGESIMAHVYQLAKLESRERITLSSFVKNTGAIAFYKRFGY